MFDVLFFIVFLLIFLAHQPIEKVCPFVEVLFINETDTLGGQGGDDYNAYAETIKYAAIVITTTPIMCIYPFLQKYFAKGVMIGAVKG